MSDTKECPFCVEEIKAAAKKCKHCGEFLEGHTRESVLRDQVGGDKISSGDIGDVKGAAIGRESQAASTGDVSGTFIQADGSVSLGKERRDEQYEIALNWDGQHSMVGFDLSERYLEEVGLQRADLRRANLSIAEVSFGSLAEAKLQKANLSDAILKKVNFQRARLQGVNLVRANLAGANFDGANLTDSDLSGAILDNTNLIGAKYNANTIWPKDFVPLTAGAILVDDKGNPIEDSDEEE